MRILIIGCSFSEDTYLDGTKTWVYRLRESLKNQPIEIVNLSKSGQGNGVISDLVIEYVEKNDVDLVLIQWSAFTRVYKEDSILSNHWKKYKGLDWEIEGLNVDTLSKKSILHSLESIVKTQRFLNNSKVNYKMWFGWQQVYPEQVNEYNVTELTDSILKDPNFLLFHQEEMFDYELENYGLFSKSNYAITLLKIFGFSKGHNYYPETNWGGMSEYIRMSLNKNKYLSKNDAHPSSEGQQAFFEGVIKPMFIEIDNTKKII